MILRIVYEAGKSTGLWVEGVQTTFTDRAGIIKRAASYPEHPVVVFVDTRHLIMRKATGIGLIVAVVRKTYLRGLALTLWGQDEPVQTGESAAQPQGAPLIPVHNPNDLLLDTAAIQPQHGRKIGG